METHETPAKMCTRCKTIKPLVDFPPHAKMRDGRNSHCRACNSEKSREAYYRRVGRELPAVKKAPPRSGARYVFDEAGEVVARTCFDCKETKPVSEFPRNRRSKYGWHSYCKPCQNARSKETYERLHGGTREYHLRRRYGLTVAKFDEMLDAQDGLCAVCRVKPAEHVDHDHLTGAVRALLCFTCNVCLGNSGDDPAVLAAAAAYLHRWAERQGPPNPAVDRLRTALASPHRLTPAA